MINESVEVMQNQTEPINSIRNASSSRKEVPMRIKDIGTLVLNIISKSSNTKKNEKISQHEGTIWNMIKALNIMFRT